MLTHLYIRLAEIALVALLAASLFFAWRAELHDREQLAAELATARQTLAAADSRQHDRDSQLLQTLSTLAAQKRETLTAQQILRALPQQIPLPAPITLTQSPNAGQAPSPTRQATDTSESAAPADKPDAQASKPDAPASKPGASARKGNITGLGNITTSQAVLPAEDLKPLYDFALDCKACQAKLAAAQGDLDDERTKSVTIAKERDAAIRAAKGGSILRRIARATKWFAIGAAAGALAARAAH